MNGTRTTLSADLAAIRTVLDLPPGERRAAIDYLDKRVRSDDEVGCEAAEAVGHFLRWGSRYGRTS